MRRIVLLCAIAVRPCCTSTYTVRSEDLAKAQKHTEAGTENVLVPALDEAQRPKCVRFSAVRKATSANGITHIEAADWRPGGETFGYLSIAVGTVGVIFGSIMASRANADPHPSIARGVGQAAGIGFSVSGALVTALGITLVVTARFSSGPEAEPLGRESRPTVSAGVGAGSAALVVRW